MKAGRAVLALAAALSSACPPSPPGSTPPDASETSGVAQPSGSSSLPPAPAAFENPGGMWLPEQLAQQQQAFKGVGFSLDPLALGKLTEFPLGAVVSLGGCSASFVSPDGLIITNHHCIVSALQANSTDDKNLIKPGYLAKTRAEELWAGPAGKVLLTQAMKDVTPYMRKDLETMKDDLARYQAIEDRTKRLVEECERGRETIRCSVSPFFGGAEYRLIEQLEIRDLRVVYAPPEMIGSYGGEIDNWRWPRHDGDFAFFRAYVGKDGKPADHSDANVPYRPEHVLKLAKDGLEAGAPVLVAGYPRATNRLTTARETTAAMESDLPYTVESYGAYLGVLEALVKADPKTAVKAETLLRGLNNNLTNTRGQLEGLSNGGLAQKKTKEQADLRTWIDAKPDRKAKYGGAIEEIDRLTSEARRTIDADRTLRDLMKLTRVFNAAYTIVRNAEERAKPDAERDPDYQERAQRRLQYTFKQMTLQLSQPVDKAVFLLAARRDLHLDKEKRAGLADAIIARRKEDGQKWEPSLELEKLVKQMYDQTKVTDEASRLKLLTKTSLAELDKSHDPFIKLALALRPKMKEMEDREKRLAGALLIARPKFVAALKDKANGVLAPDANGTLRITYGTVRGYAPKPGAPVFKPFTVLSEVVKKHTGKEPFDAPQALRDAVAAKKFGAYVDHELGEVPVDFLADLDISQGSSGSATLNARGELVGLAFDGNYESQAQSWIFIPEVTRSIHVDLRYVLWVLDAVANADDLLREMGIEPSI